MKRNFAVYLVFGTVLAASAAGTIRVFGQSGPNRPSNNYAVNGSNYQPQPYGVGGGIQTGPYIPIQNYGVAGLPPQPMGGNQFQPNPNMQGSKHNHAFILKKSDGSFEQIEKEPGVPFSPEEMQQVNDARQKLQNAISQVRSPDADDSKKKESKDLIAKYLKAEFKADQESRREHVERLEKQVAQLRKQLTKRDESQDKLIELRMQLLENDASGLSFPDSWGNLSGPQPFVGQPGFGGNPMPPPNTPIPSYFPSGPIFFTANPDRPLSPSSPIPSNVPAKPSASRE